MKYNRVQIVLALAAAFTLLAAPGAAQTAQGGLSSLGINVSPAKFELSMTPGMSYNVPISIQNGSTFATHIQAYMVDFGLTQTGNYQFAKPGSSPFSLMRWASINPREFDLPQGTMQQVRLSLAVPKGQTLSGEYSGIVFFQTRPLRSEHRGVAFSIRIATKVYLTIPGTVKIAGAISKMSSAPGRNPDNGAPAQFYHILFKNTGNAHIYLNGTLDVRRGGDLVDHLQLVKNELVERGEERLITAYGKALPSGKYQAIALVDYGGSTVTGGEIAFDKK